MIRRLLLFILIAANSPSAPPASCKPTAPIEIDARLVGDPSAPFAVAVKASSKAGPVDLEVVLPDGVTAAGPRKAFGPTCEVRMDAVAHGRSRREILVRATVTVGGARMTRVVPLVLFDGPAPAPKGLLKTNSRGERIVVLTP